MRNLERMGQPGIARASETHVDDPNVVSDRPIQAFQDVGDTGFAVGAMAGEYPDAQDLSVGSDAHQLVLRRDRAGNARAVRMRLTLRPDGVVLFDGGAAEIWVWNVDLWIDYRDRNIVAPHHPVHLRKLQLIAHVVRGTDVVCDGT